jgi:putative cell wall-binding protein
VNWADPTGLGYQSTAHWGVGHLVAAPPAPPAPTPPASNPTPTRIAGADRIGTAIAASQTLFPNPGSAGAVVIARSDSYPDAMVGIPLAAAKNAPLLFAQGGELSQATQTEIRRLLAAGGTVYLLGGTTALPDSVASTVTQLGFKPVRYSGADRYATSLAVAQALGNPSTVLLATGNNFPDALAAGAAAAHLHGVVLLTTGGTLSTAVRAYLAAHPGTVYTVGGPAAAAYPAGKALVGKDRYDTAAKVAAAVFSSPSTLGIASGATFADALSGGAFEGIMGGPMLLTDPSALPDSTKNYLGGVSAALSSSTLFGGTSAVTASVQQALNAALGG